jgi:hypothetical protein
MADRCSVLSERARRSAPAKDPPKIAAILRCRPRNEIAGSSNSWWALQPKSRQYPSGQDQSGSVPSVGNFGLGPPQHIRAPATARTHLRSCRSLIAHVSEPSSNQTFAAASASAISGQPTRKGRSWPTRSLLKTKERHCNQRFTTSRRSSADRGGDVTTNSKTIVTAH